MKLFRYISDIFNVFSKAAKIRENEEACAKSVRFAISSIVYSILMFGCAALGGLLIGLNETGILYIFLVVIAVVFLISVLVCFVGALLRVIVQFTLNRRAASWIALIIFILSVAASVIIILYLLK